MIYRAIGLMSGSSLDGLDIAFVHFHEKGGNWIFDLEYADCVPYTPEWVNKLQSAIHLNALEYQLLHAEYGHLTGEMVNAFIDKNHLHYQVQFIASHGHTTFHVPHKRMTAQLGDGAAIAAETGIPVISNLRNLDVALGGQGAPIVPIGDKLLFGHYAYCLNLGGIANLSAHQEEKYVSFDVCPANRVLNLLAGRMNRDYDPGGQMASTGRLNEALLEKLNRLPYYALPYPKSLSNDFGNETVFPLVIGEESDINHALHTYCEHIAIQVRSAVERIERDFNRSSQPVKMLVTGGGALNSYLVSRIQMLLEPHQVELEIPDEHIVQFKEALVMAFMGVLRWRDENNVLSSVTGALRNSIGGAIWMGHEV